MTHLIGGLMSWMNSGMTQRHRNDLLTWAQTEYRQDWQYAYNFMLRNEGRAPTHRELHGPMVRKEVA